MSIIMKTKSEKHLEMIQTLQYMNKSRANTVNCIGHNIYCELEDKNSFILLGKWKTREALNQYIASYKFSVLLGTKALLCEPLDIQIFTVSHSEGMDAVHSIREQKSKQAPIDTDR